MVAIFITIVMFMIIIFVLARYFTVKKELKEINRQLHMYNHRQTDKKIDVALFDQTIENLGEEINKLIDLHVTEHRKRVNFESEYKRMIANMSHDLRTPLTSILGYIQMAQKDGITIEERNELLAIALERANRLEILLKDFFELSIIDSHDYYLTLKRINLSNIIVDVLMSFYDQFQEQNREPAINIPEHDICIVGDESAVTRVLENLLANAMTHADGQIMIKLEQQDHLAKLIVKNNAHNLTDHDVQFMFDRFYMADKSRSGRSTGLGLSIVKSLMEKMNGTIDAYLEDGKLSIICTWKLVTKNKVRKRI